MDKKILIVDDEPDIIKVAMFRLKKRGFEVITAVNGQEGIEKVREHMPDLILLDLRLPILDGSEVSRQIKADDALKHIPIILSTASTDNIEDVVKECGADDYVIKPFEPQELFEKIEKLLQGCV